MNSNCFLLKSPGLKACASFLGAGGPWNLVRFLPRVFAGSSPASSWGTIFQSAFTSPAPTPARPPARGREPAVSRRLPGRELASWLPLPPLSPLVPAHLLSRPSVRLPRAKPRPRALPPGAGVLVLLRDPDPGAPAPVLRLPSRGPGGCRAGRGGGAHAHPGISSLARPAVRGPEAPPQPEAGPARATAAAARWQGRGRPAFACPGCASGAPSVREAEVSASGSAPPACGPPVHLRIGPSSPSAPCAPGRGDGRSARGPPFPLALCVCPGPAGALRAPWVCPAGGGRAGPWSRRARATIPRPRRPAVETPPRAPRSPGEQRRRGSRGRPGRCLGGTPRARRFRGERRRPRAALVARWR